MKPFIYNVCPNCGKDTRTASNRDEDTYNKCSNLEDCVSNLKEKLNYLSDKFDQFKSEIEMKILN